jgi:cytochrome c biogenesis protein CcdA
MTADFTSLIVASIARLFTLFSPCSYPLLPGYILYYLGSDVSMRRGFYGRCFLCCGAFLNFRGGWRNCLDLA